MPTEQAESFSDNWAYLKTELQWLERMLMTAVARYRKETKEIERVAQSKADRATSHWWKGVISIEGHIAYDEYRQPTPSGSGIKSTYGQQIEARIQASRERGVILALPTLCDRLNLTSFEKNLVLMGLAPEVNRRYARLYRFLQGEEATLKTDLPTLDLVLRLFCRNDQEWRSARSRIVAPSPLVTSHLLQLLHCPGDTLLNAPLKLTDSLVNYLLAEHPTVDALDQLFQPSLGALPTKRLMPQDRPVDWSDLILPRSDLESLQYWVQRIQGYRQIAQTQRLTTSLQVSPGIITLLNGPSGTGKTMAAQAMAHALQTPLFTLDLAQIPFDEAADWLEAIQIQAPIVLLLQSAHCWFGRSTQLPTAILQRFLAQRQQVVGITVLSTEHPALMRRQWPIAHTLSLPMPNRADRRCLWQRAFPPQVPLNAHMNWERLADRLALTGGEIKRIADETILYATALQAPQIELDHIKQVLKQHGKPLK